MRKGFRHTAESARGQGLTEKKDRRTGRRQKNMQADSAILTPSPTRSGIPFRPADFDNFVDALDYAAEGACGFSYYNSRGEVAEVLSHRQLRDDAKSVAGRLLALGLRHGDRVAILAETEADFARAFAGAIYAGLAPAPLPLPVAFSARESYNDLLRRIVAVAGARAVISSTEYEDWVAEAMAPVDLLWCGLLRNLPEAEGVAPEPGSIKTTDLAYLQFSSGTTGSPKGIAVTHGSMMANLHAIATDGLTLCDDDRGVTWLPLYHDMGLVGCFLTPIATQISTDNLATKDFIRRPLFWLELIQRNRGTITFAPTLGYDLALRRSRGKAPEGLDLSSWRVAGLGADMIKAPVVHEFGRVFSEAGFDPAAFTPSYGMAETTLALSFAPLRQGLKTARLDLDALERRMEARLVEHTDDLSSGKARDFALCGPVLPRHAVEIRDESGALLPPGRVGRIFASGPSLMREYFGDPENTTACLSDGWLDTGDLGYIATGEYAGQIVITGRAKDLMIVNGRNIWPQDLEWTVEKNIEHVREGGVAAFAVMTDDRGAKIDEEIVVVAECRLRDDEAREELRAEINARVREAHGVEVKVALARNGELPSTSSGKLSRAKTRLMYLDNLFDLKADGAA